MDRHVAEDKILVSYFKYFIVFFDSILKIFLYLRRLFKFLPSVLSIIPATPQREPSLQGGRGLLFCSCLSGCHHSCKGARGVRFLSFLLLPEDSNLLSCASPTTCISSVTVVGFFNWAMKALTKNITPCRGDHRVPGAGSPHGVHHVLGAGDGILPPSPAVTPTPLLQARTSLLS